MVDYENALKRPFQDIKKLLIGSILAIIPIVNFMYVGYVAKTAKNTLTKNNDMPEWEAWGDLFMKGLTIVIIGILYAIPAGLFLFAGIGTIILTAIASKGAIGIGSIIASGGIVLILGVLLLVFTWFFVPMAVMRYVDKESMKEAFAFGKIAKKAFTGNYIIAWILMTIYSVVISAVLLIIPIVGTAIATFISGITTMTVFAEVYNEEE